MQVNKYNNSKIYRIICNITGKQYYGSTTEPTIARRLAKHKNNFKTYTNGGYHFVTSFKVLENGNYNIVLVENVICNSIDELHQRERFYIDNNDCVNKQVPLRTDAEYYLDNKDKIKLQTQNYAQRNPEKVKEYSKIYRLKNAEKIKLRNSIAYKNKKQVDV
jgi:hypothetical protein